MKSKDGEASFCECVLASILTTTYYVTGSKSIISMVSSVNNYNNSRIMYISIPRSCLQTSIQVLIASAQRAKRNGGRNKHLKSIFVFINSSQKYSLHHIALLKCKYELNYIKMTLGVFNPKLSWHILLLLTLYTEIKLYCSNFAQ